MSSLVVGPETIHQGGIILEDNPLDDPFGIDFPDKLKVIRYPGEKYALYVHENDHGLAVFSSEGRAILFTEHLRGKIPSGSEILDVSFDEAHDIAVAKGAPVVCMMLLDDLSHPQKHYVV